MFDDNSTLLFLLTDLNATASFLKPKIFINTLHYKEMMCARRCNISCKTLSARRNARYCMKLPEHMSKDFILTK